MVWIHFYRLAAFQYDFRTDKAVTIRFVITAGCWSNAFVIRFSFFVHLGLFIRLIRVFGPCSLARFYLGSYDVALVEYNL